MTSKDAKRREYTLHSLFLPDLRARPFADVVGILMTHPVVWISEAGLSLLMILLILASSLVNFLDPATWIFIVGFGSLAAFAFPLVYVAFLWLIDFYEREPIRIIVSLFLWGSASTFFSFILNTLGGGILMVLLGARLGEMGATIFGAPIVEEFFKGFGLLLIAGHHEMEDTFDGLLYGFTVGAGFAAIESFLYFSQTPVPHTGFGFWFLFILYRSTICAIGHGCFTGTTGLLIGFFKNRERTKHLAQLAVIPSILLAMGIHALFNLTAIIQGEVMAGFTKDLVVGLAPIFHGPLIGLIGGFYFFVIIPMALWESRERVRRKALSLAN